MAEIKFTSVTEYIAAAPQQARKHLREMRALVRAAAPDAEEVISYNMPAYRLHGVLLFFAGYNSHIGFYPSGSGLVEFQTEISRFKNSKGAVQFPLDEPLPVKLITQMVKFRVKENREKALLKKDKRR